MRAYNWLDYFVKGIFAKKGSLADKISFLRDFQTISQQQHRSQHKFSFGKPYPILNEKKANAGTAEGHYFHQDLLIAQRIFLNNPQHHVDVGSKVDSFVAHVASFRTIEVFDIRELSNNIPNIQFTKQDLMRLDPQYINYCDSLSCLHALEHFGLGRYGDSVNYDGYIAGLNNMDKILRPGGKFYLSVPIGQQRIEFNAHRVFSIKLILDLLADKYHLDHFSYVGDNGSLNENVFLNDSDIRINFNCTYGCGIFELTKNATV